jgi:hypothetical protein
VSTGFTIATTWLITWHFWEGKRRQPIGKRHHPTFNTGKWADYIGGMEKMAQFSMGSICRQGNGEKSRGEGEERKRGREGPAIWTRRIKKRRQERMEMKCK